jgi:hypothetical protein
MSGSGFSQSSRKRIDDASSPPAEQLVSTRDAHRLPTAASWHLDSRGYVNNSYDEGLPPISNNPNIIPNLLAPGQYGMPSNVLNAMAFNVVSCRDEALGQAVDDEMSDLRRGSPSPWDAILTSNALTSNVDPPPQAPQEHCA